jgi:hypothetical protein
MDEKDRLIIDIENRIVAGVTTKKGFKEQMETLRKLIE